MSAGSNAGSANASTAPADTNTSAWTARSSPIRRLKIIGINMATKNKKKADKIKLGIFDMTDCEGCEVVLVSLGQKIVDFFEHTEIIDWRLGQKMVKDSDLDLAIIEGAPITEDEIEQLKKIRAKSKVLEIGR